MTSRDIRAAGIAAGAGLAIVIVLAGLGLINRANMVTSGGAPPDGALVAIPTAAPVLPDENGAVFCNAALFIGRVVAHPEWGIAVRSEGGEPLLTFWPHGYLGRVVGDQTELLDGEGLVVARTGDDIEAGGGMATIGGREGFEVCPVGIEVQPAEP